MLSEITIAYALSFQGVPYLWGGQSPIEGVDCSGLTILVLQAEGLFPRKFDTNAQGIFDVLIRKDAKPIDKPERGAIAFYGTSIHTITHVAIVLDGRQIIEAGGGNSRTTSKKRAHLNSAHVRISTVKSRSDLVAILRLPPGPN